MLVKILAAALVVLGILFLALLWLVAYLAGISFWIPGSITALVVVVPVVWFVVRRIQARQAASGLERALAAQAGQEALMTRPDLQMEVRQMQAEFEKAVQALKKSRLGRRGRDALYLLPWYAIIGPPGVGKTTALRHSGLKFPHLSDSGGGVKGLGGTRNCDWWLTNHAVVLDTAGRWATQQEDHEEWLAFLDLLKRHRRDKPLNGLITAVSVADLAAATPEQVKSVAERMRARVDEVMGHLRVSLPVYVVFTKCDLIPGFAEMFGDMARADRAQVLGFTAPLARSIGEPGAFFKKRFDEIVSHLEDRALARMSEERRLDTRWKIFEFPQQLGALRDTLATFVGVLFQESVFQDSPRLRGAYFTSGTQEGRPVDRIMSRLAAAIGIQNVFADEAPVVSPKSYFLHDVFMNVIFEDRELASASEAELGRRRLRNLMMCGILTLIALGFSVPPALAWQRSRDFLASTAALVEQSGERPAAAEALPEKAGRLVDVGELEPLWKRIQLLAAYQEDGAPWSMGFGMYHGDELLTPLRDYHATTIHAEVVRPIMAMVVQRLADFGWKYATLVDAQPSAQEHATHRELLKLHLLLSGPREVGEPALGPAEKEWIVGQLVSRWAQAHEGSDKAVRGAMKTHAAFYVELFAARPALAFVRDSDVVQRSRNALNRVSSSHLALRRIVKQLSDEGYDLTLASLIGSSAAATGTTRVRGAFTRRAWEEKVRDRMLGAAVSVEEAWVLGGGGAQEEMQRQLQAKLADQYFRAYIEEWQRFIRDVRVHRPEDNEQALILLQDLTRGQPPPIGRLIREIHRNVDLAPDAAKKGEAEGEAGEQQETSILDKVVGAVDSLKGKVKELEKHVDGSRSSGASAAGQQELLGPKDVAEAFAAFTKFAVAPDTGSDQPPPPVDLDVYQEQLSFVRDALLRQKENPGESEELAGILQLARTRVQALVEAQDIGWRPRFKSLLWPPIEGATVTSAAGAAKAKSSDWCTEVVVPFMKTIWGRYPFNSDGNDAPLSDFASFYQPHTGILWRFYDERLKGIAPRKGAQFVFETKLGEDAGTVYVPELLDFLARSQDITTVFFPAGATTPKLVFDVRIHPSPAVATIVFSSGGLSIDYHNGPEQWTRLEWPGENVAEGTGFVVRGANGMHERVWQEGEWGLFRLLEAGTVTRHSDRLFSVGWRLETHRVDIGMDFRPARGESPFYGIPGSAKTRKLMQPVRDAKVRIPSRILRGGEHCKS